MIQSGHIPLTIHDFRVFMAFIQKRPQIMIRVPSVFFFLFGFFYKVGESYIQIG